MRSDHPGAVVGLAFELGNLGDCRRTGLPSCQRMKSQKTLCNQRPDILVSGPQRVQREQGERLDIPPVWPP